MKINLPVLKTRSSNTVINIAEPTKLSQAFQTCGPTDLVSISNALSDALRQVRRSQQALSLKEDLSVEPISHFSITAPALNSNRHAGNLITTDEIINALLRDKEKGKEHSPGKRSDLKAEDEQIEDENVGFYGKAIKPSKWGLSNYLESVASTREKRIVAVSAWFLSLSGLIVALVFVTRDFLTSRKELSSAVRYEAHESMKIPSLYFCDFSTSFHPFIEYPTDTFKGQPLMWVDFVEGGDLEGRVSFPKTHSMEQFKLMKVDSMGNSCNQAAIMDVKVFEREQSVLPKCGYCLSLVRSPPINLFANQTLMTEDLISSTNGSQKSHLSVRISRHSALKNCRLLRLGISRNILRFFKQEIKKNWRLLEERGILDYGGITPSDFNADGYLWPDYRAGYLNNTYDINMIDLADMLCNVYFFSNFFYPAASHDIKYRFERKYLLWERSGVGPYYPANLTIEPILRGELEQHNGTLVEGIGAEKYEEQATWASESIAVMTNQSQRGGFGLLSTLAPNEMVFLKMRQGFIRDLESFSAKNIRMVLDNGDVKLRNYIYFMDISFDSFLTRQVSNQETVSWSAFIADFFGLTSLFLDISVYTLIVAPLVMRGRQKALIARKRMKNGKKRMAEFGRN